MYFSALVGVALNTEIRCIIRMTIPTGPQVPLEASQASQRTSFFQQRECHDFESEPWFPLVMLSWIKVNVQCT